jgi:FtsP/CotA-like multicopper oxidase with cupredoxin domain
MPAGMTDKRLAMRPPPTRRATLACLASAAALTLSGESVGQPAPLLRPAGPSEETTPRPLVAAPGKARLRPAPAGETEVLTLNGVTPAPTLRIKQGETLRLRLENRTALPLALHWHGLRGGAAAMDGVGGFSQPPVAPGENFEYRLTPPDSGTILYRAMVLGGSSEPAGRGLAGMLVVEEAAPLPVDLDLPVLVGDWLLGDDHAIRTFATRSEAAAAGRLGSWLTVNGGPPPQHVAVRPGSRVRLRLANACNARIMRLRFDGVKAHVIAVDGQPTDTFEPVRAQLPFAPGTRYDLVVDMPAEAGQVAGVTALIGAGVPLVRLVAEGEPKKPPTEPVALKPNPALPAGVRQQDARRPQIVIEGGAKLTSEAKLDFAGLDLARPWTLNGSVGDLAKPLFSVRRGTPIVLAIDNRTAFLQPIHVHGHAFRLLHPLDDGWEPYFLDTVQIPENRKLHIAFIADNPGKWLISSSVLERFDLGLWTWFEVT